MNMQTESLKGDGNSVSRTPVEQTRELHFEPKHSQDLDFQRHIS